MLRSRGSRCSSRAADQSPPVWVAPTGHPHRRPDCPAKAGVCDVAPRPKGDDVATAVASPPATEPARQSEEERLRAARRKERISVLVWRIAGYAFFLTGWELASGTLMDERLLPGPIEVVQTFGDLWASGEVPGA